MMDKDRARELIRKLTKHAENPSATPAERESYLAKARELAAKVGERPPTDTSRGNTDEITLEKALRVVCNFGKYRGRQLQQVMRDDLGYWLWMVNVAKSGHESMYLEQRLAILKLEENRERLGTSPDDHEREQNRREADKTRKTVNNAWKKYEARKKDRDAAAAHEEAERLAKELKDFWETMLHSKGTNIPNGKYTTPGTANTVTTNSGQKINVVSWRIVDSDDRERCSRGFDVTG